MIAYGDAYVIEGNPCAAFSQYQNALTILSDPGVSAKRDNADVSCQQGTAVPGSGTGSLEVAPVGVPSSP
jgi:hypothetical protein